MCCLRHQDASIY
ncbi:BnaA02g20150D [Brassica napus]|uniref:BnaA02g20150D protein n=1 Tax=Brassica napus TaxID=3708 RepID=A0A078HGX3_BRANA|nr:BnaA02g20150D [Brassica napus]